MNRHSDRPGIGVHSMPSTSGSPFPQGATVASAMLFSQPQQHQQQSSPRSARPCAHSPCPAICSWPAPPANPRAELKPTAIAAPLTIPSSCSARSTLSAILPQLSLSNSHLQLQQQSPNPTQSPSLQMSANSPHRSPIPHHDDDNMALLTMFRAASINSAPPGGNSPIGHWGRETELRQKIQALEENVADYERQKLNVLGTFTDFRERVSERERQLEAEYSHKIIDLSEEVLGAKRDFEERMKSFQMLQEKFEREKEQALEKLRQDHQREIQALEQRFSQSQLLNLEKKYLMEIQKLEEERNGLKTERGRLGEEFKVKLRRAESLFEMELTASKMLYTRELQALREHEEALKDELAARQEEFHDRLLEMQYQSRQSKDELVHCREELAQLEMALEHKAAEIQRLSKELAVARRQTEETIERLGQEAKTAARELSAQRERAEQLRGAEEARERLEETVRELRKEFVGLRSRADLLEGERDGLRAQCESQAQLHDSQVTALEAMLQSVTSEKDGCHELLEKERAEAEERELTLRREFSSKLGELEEQYNGLRQHVEEQNIAEHFEPENVKLWEEIECLRAEKSDLEKELSAERTAQQNEHTNGLTKLAGAIQTLEKSTMSEKRSDGEEEEAAENEFKGWKANPPVEVLLEKLAQLELSVERIVREKKKMETRLERLGEGEMGWTKRLTEMERKLEQQREQTERAEQNHRQQKQQMAQQVAALKLALEELSDVEERLREAEKRAMQAESEAERVIRKLEEEHAMAIEQKMNTLNKEHERTVELMVQREREMEETLEELRKRKNDGRDERTEMAVGETQTAERWQAENEPEEFSKSDAWNRLTEMPVGETQTEEWRSEDEADRASPRENEKDELIRKLKKELDEAKRVKHSTIAKEGRAQSIASAGEHFLICQKTFGESGKDEKKECRRHDQLKGLEHRKVQSPTQLGYMDTTMPRDDLLPAQCSAQFTSSSAASSQRSLLSSSAGVCQQQRVSPSRQMAAISAKNGKGNGNTEKRPAWKF